MARKKGILTGEVPKRWRTRGFGARIFLQPKFWRLHRFSGDHSENDWRKKQRNEPNHKHQKMGVDRKIETAGKVAKKREAGKRNEDPD